MPRRLAALSALLLLATPPAPAAAPGKLGPPDVVLNDCLVIPPVGAHGRAPLHVDLIEAALVAGRWKAPRAGDTVTLPGGEVRTWAKARAGKDGAVSHPALRGGYLYWRVRADSERVVLLEASGHLHATVNCAPRAGDPYGNGIVRLPVLLRKGDNDLLFHVARGRLAARLTTPPAPVLLDTRDLTLPDLLEGHKEPPWAALVLVNASTAPLKPGSLRASQGDAEPLRTPVPAIPPLSVRKVGFRVPPTTAKAGASVTVRVRLEAAGAARRPAEATLTLGVRSPTQSHKRTFLSDVDGSVQYYAVQPAHPAAGQKRPPGIVLTLHGAGVEAVGQVNCYSPKTFAHVVAPTNRRPFGFDWEDWGRLDALEVLADARKRLGADPPRTYLTGHSMGGHGVWHLGATFPDCWAAIAPSAGWISFATYPRPLPPPKKTTPLQEMLRRPASPGDTPRLARNYAWHGVYVLHGSDDDNVPVAQARTMRQLLGTFHPDFAYHERPGAGHWWGNECVDWPPLFEFLAARSLPRTRDVRRVDFVTASPGVSATCHWARVEMQEKVLKPSEVHLRCDPVRRLFAGTTANVARLALDLAHLKPGGLLTLDLDGQKLDKVPWPKGARLWLERAGGKWSVTRHPSPDLKGPDRYGPFKDAFRHRAVFVYGTKGTPQENAWAFAKARYDAETFWYRGNASVDVVADTDFDPARDRDRGVILYGHSQSNRAWKALVGDSPVQVRRGQVVVGRRKEKGDDLACLFARPRPGSARALVGVVSGTGPAGLRLTERLPYFLSGVAYPDCVVLGPDVLTAGDAGVRGAGFFGVDWGVDSGEFVWRKRAL
jgi:dienelactone hydrolase